MIGGRNRYIDIQTAARSGDSIGGRSTAYSSAKKIWANVKPMNGRRLVEFGQATNMKGYEIEIPFYLETTVDETVKIVYDGRELWVHSVIDNEEGRTTKIIIAFEKK
jgi:SPP1 family predicted phage head-tail adaptor